MKTRLSCPLTLIATLVLVLPCLPALQAAQDTNSPPVQVDSNAMGDPLAVLRANLLLQEQVRNLQRSLEDYQRQMDQQNAINSQYGISGTPYGAGVAGQTASNFNLWQKLINQFMNLIRIILIIYGKQLNSNL